MLSHVYYVTYMLRNHSDFFILVKMLLMCNSYLTYMLHTCVCVCTYACMLRNPQRKATEIVNKLALSPKVR